MSAGTQGPPLSGGPPPKGSPCPKGPPACPGHPAAPAARWQSRVPPSPVSHHPRAVPGRGRQRWRGVGGTGHAWGWRVLAPPPRATAAAPPPLPPQHRAPPPSLGPGLCRHLVSAHDGDFPPTRARIVGYIHRLFLLCCELP